MAKTGLKRAGAGGRGYTLDGIEYDPGVSGTPGVAVARTNALPIATNTLDSTMTFVEEMTQNGTRFAEDIDVPQIETVAGVLTYNVNEALGKEYVQAGLGAKSATSLVTATAVGTVVTTAGAYSDVPVTGAYLTDAGVLVNPGTANEEPAQIISYSAGHLLLSPLTINAAAVNPVVTQPAGTLYANSLLPAGYEDDLPMLSMERVIRKKWGRLFKSILVEKLEYTFGTGIAKLAATLYGTASMQDLTGPLPAPIAPVPTTATTGGTVLAGAYGVILTYVNATGEGLGSIAGTVTTTGTTSTLTIPSPAAVNSATGFYAYVTQLGGSVYTRQQTAGSPTAIGTALTLTAPPTNTGTNPPVSDTSSQLTAYNPSTSDEAAALSPFTAINAMIAVNGDPEGTGTSTFRGAISATDGKISFDNGLIKQQIQGNPVMQAWAGDKVVCTVDFNALDTAQRDDVWFDFVKADKPSPFKVAWVKNRGTSASPSNELYCVTVPNAKFRSPKMTDEAGKLTTFAHQMKGLVLRSTSQDMLRVWISS